MNNQLNIFSKMPRKEIEEKRALILEMYNANHTMSYIRKELNTHYNTILKILAENNIEVRETKHYTKSDIDVIRVLELWKEFQSVVEIGKLLDVSKTPIVKILNKHNIFPGNECRTKTNTNLTREQIYYVEGALLGDGHLQKKSLNNTPRFSHCSIHLEYSIYLQSSLPFKFMNIQTKEAHSSYKKLFDRVVNQNTSYSIQTKTDLYFNSIYDKWYINKLKIVPGDLVLTPELCRIWFMDDGCNYIATRYNTKQGEKYTRSIILCTDNFSEADVTLLTSKLYNTGFKSLNIVKTVSKYSLKEQFRIKINHTCVEPFLNYIGTCPVSCFSYKWKL